MESLTLVRVAFQALLRNKTRSLLTTLGIIIGVAAVILLVSLGNGLQVYISDQFESIGTNNIYVMPYNLTDSEGKVNFGSSQPSSSLKGFKNSDLRAVKRIGYPLELVTPVIEKQVDISYKGKTKTRNSNSSTADIFEARSLVIEQGRFFTVAEEERNRKVVVLGNRIAKDLFDNEDPISRTVAISSSKFKIIGVMKKVGGGGGIGPSLDDEIYIPLSVGQNLFNTDTFDYITIKVVTTEEIPYAIESIKEVIGKKRDKKDFSVIDQQQFLDTITNILGILTTAVGGIAAISLLVGGIGIMNIMLVSVTERTREIGLRKAIGATPIVILFQFLIESIVLSVIGGGIGVAIGIGGSIIINKFFPAAVSPESIILAFGVSAFVGIVFGIIPARRAARLSPIEALRYE